MARLVPRERRYDLPGVWVSNIAVPGDNLKPLAVV